MAFPKLLKGKVPESRLKLLQRQFWMTMPPSYKDILSRLRVEFTVWKGNPDKETVKEVRLDIADPSVRLFTYQGYSAERDAEGNIVTEVFDIYVFGVEDLGITTPDGHRYGMDDWKDLIVSIRRIHNVLTEPAHEITITFQVTYTSVVVYLDDEEVFRSEAGTAVPPLKVISFPA